MPSAPVLLLVNNDVGVLTALAVLLSGDFVVETANTAGEALGMIACGIEPDLIVADVYLDRLDGIALRSELPAWLRSRVVLMTCSPVRGAMASAIHASGVPVVHRSTELHLLEPIMKAVA